MGVRIHKCIGYGLTDLGFDGRPLYKPNDPRINRDGILFAHDPEDGDWSKQVYLRWLEEEQARQADEFEADELRLERTFVADLDWMPYQSVIYGAEYLSGNVLVIIPPTCVNGWSRYADPIDYIEEGLRQEWRNRWTELPEGIYPYSRAYMDARTGEPIYGDGPEAYLRVQYSLKLAEEHPTKPRVSLEEYYAALDRAARHMGFADRNEAELYMKPLIPRPVKYIAEFCKLFTSWDVLRQLRPLLYVYYS